MAINSTAPWGLIPSRSVFKDEMKFREKTEIKTARFFENLIYFYFVFPVLGVTLCSLVVSDRFWIRRMLSEDPAALHTLRTPSSLTTLG
ncbi:MAG TPA: hypothetical protein VJ864_15980, partial [Candidatus Binatia bacterium]|nr:hypothetical protein [Candidatus Binatia bacterium]